MDTEQRKRPETGQRSPRPNTEKKAASQKTASRKRTTERTRAAAGQASRSAPQKKRTAAARTQRQAPAPPRRRPAPEIVYTPPKPFSRNRLLLQLATIVAVVLALALGISIFFKVNTITVSGMEKYSAWAVREASGIQEGDNLLTFGEAKAQARILAALPYVEDVRIGIKLPDTVNIEIKEFDVVYAIRDQSGGWWLITSEGTIVEQADSATAGQYTQVLGVLLSVPRAGEQAVALEPVPTVIDEESGETLPVTVTGGQQLSAALQILQCVESSSLIGKIASVDVTDVSQLELWYGQQYQVELGDATQLSYKISCVKEAIDTLDDYQSGVLDASFTIWPDGVGYTAFS